MKDKYLTLRQCMTTAQLTVMGKFTPTTHQNCIDKTGVARPGKTKRDRLKRLGMNPVK